MKNNVFKMIVVLIIIVLVVMATALLNNKESGQKADYVRIHIRANSNSDIDQNLKQVRQGTVLCLAITSQ
ncbi:MAG: hypothetical protein ACOX3U_06550 [Christensenellales bacterium]|jgi:uncharacterized protein YxeA